MAVLSMEQVAAAALAAGWTPAQAVIATAITSCESSRDATVVQAGQPYATTGWGLWQITPGDSVPRFGTDKQLLNPLANARAAHYKWEQAGGWDPWTTYEDGCYRQWLPAAEKAVAAVAHLSAAQRRALAAEAGSGGDTGTGGGASGEDWSPYIIAAATAHAGAARSLQGHARGIRRLAPHLHAPKVTVPAPGRVLWVPGRQK
jgi:hypothetical protein